MAIMRLPKPVEPLVPVIRYLLTGGSAVAVEFVSFLFLFYVISSSLIMSNSLSFVLGMLTSFLLNRQWAFKGSKGRMHHQLMMYVMLALLNVSLANLLIWQFTAWGMLPFMAKPLIIALTATWNYFLFKKVIFKADTLDTDPTSPDSEYPT